MTMLGDERDKPKEPKKPKERKKSEDTDHTPTMIFFTAIIIIIFCFIGVFIFIIKPSAQTTTTNATLQPSAFDIAKGKYINWYRIGQSFNMTVGGHVYTEQMVFIDDGTTESYIKMTFNGVSSNGSGYLTLNDSWNGGSSTLYVSKGTIFLSGAGKFKVSYIDQSTITLSVMSWSPPSSDFR
jgi:hypothetical protein